MNLVRLLSTMCSVAIIGSASALAQSNSTVTPTAAPSASSADSSVAKVNGMSMEHKKRMRDGKLTPVPENPVPLAPPTRSPGAFANPS
jgi:hypothetical protein